MGFMKTWEKMSQNLYDKWGSKFQNQYDTFRLMKSPAWYIALTNGIWVTLDNEAKAFLNNLLAELVKRFDEEFAKDVITKVTDKFKN